MAARRPFRDGLPRSQGSAWSATSRFPNATRHRAGSSAASMSAPICWPRDGPRRRTTSSAMSSTGPTAATSCTRRRSPFRPAAAHRDVLRPRPPGARPLRRFGLIAAGSEDARATLCRDRARRGLPRHRAGTPYPQKRWCDRRHGAAAMPPCAPGSNRKKCRLIFKTWVVSIKRY
jgi:hypothetical protein